LAQIDVGQYDTLSKVFHWATAVAVLVAFVLGPGDFGRLVRSGVDPATRLDIVWHESLGMAVFVLTFLRLIWVSLRPAAPKHQMAPLMLMASKLAHIGLWALLFALPLTALLSLGSEGNPLTLLGEVRVNELPWIASSPLAELADWGEVHGFIGDAIMWLAGAHALAAIYHHYKVKDNVLRSMLP
jgi:cytochrome b561